MAKVAVDFGAGLVRIATDQDRAQALLPRCHTVCRTPRAISLESGDTGNVEGVPGCPRIVSLKRALDFDTFHPIGQQQVKSVTLVADMLRAIRAGCRTESPDEALGCVLSVPPCFTQRQRSALRDAATQAGFSSVRLADDTLAVLLECQGQLSGCETVLVYAWGAGSFSVALYRCRDRALDVLAQEGDRALGGDDIDAAIAGLLLAALARTARAALPVNDSGFLQRMVAEAELAKHAVACGRDAEIPVARLWHGATGCRRDAGATTAGQSVLLEAAACQKLMQPMVEKTMQLVKTALSRARCEKVDAVLLAGGTSRLPAVGEALKDQLGVVPLLSPDEAVVFGTLTFGAVSAEKADGKSAKPETKIRERESGGQTPAGGPDAPAGPPAAGLRVPPTGGIAELLAEVEKLDAAGRTVDAIRELDRLQRELGGLSAALCRREAVARDAVGHTAEALDLLRKAHRDDPLNRQVAVELAKVCRNAAGKLWQQKRGNDALRLNEEGVEALRSHPDAATTYASLLAELLCARGALLASTGEIQAAEETLVECVKLQPEQAEYRAALAQVREAGRQARGKAQTGTGATDRGASRPISTVGRNKPCPCGSGEKYKHCCGRR